VKVRAERLWETEKPRDLEPMGWALAWYKVERQETKKSKSERVVYLTPKSSTTKTKSIGRETYLKRHGVEVSWKPKVERRETRRRLESFPASLRPYIVLSIRKTMLALPEGLVLRKGRKLRWERTAEEN
jgi:hypothetical protein